MCQVPVRSVQLKNAEARLPRHPRRGGKLPANLGNLAHS